jgi:hypothetical protein
LISKMRMVHNESRRGKQEGSIVAGMAICWLLNIAQLGISWLLLVADDRMLSVVFVLAGLIGLVQVGYVAPIWRLLRRKGKVRTAKGLLWAAIFTLAANAGVWIFGGKLRSLMQ